MTDDEPKTIFEFERRRRSLERHEGGITDEVPPTCPWAVPRLPPTSPWASDPVPAEEPIDRTEDGAIITRGEN
jgi:hypothetical protein